jgi:hypothetical protein
LDEPRFADDLAYLLPMGIFLVFTEIGNWWPSAMPALYVGKTALAAGLLIGFRGRYAKIRWNYAWLGVIVGIVGVVQWVGMEKAILAVWPHYPHAAAAPFDPKQIGSPALRDIFVAVRFAGPVLVVPFMEELFWRDYLWRSLAAPNNFRLAQVGEWDVSAFAVVTILFASVHVQWVTALVWGALVAWLLVRTKSLGACIVAHAVTNLLLGIYVMATGDLSFW